MTLSLTVPGLANAFLLLFAASLADFATPLILAGNDFPVLPTEAFLQITGMFDLEGRRGCCRCPAGSRWNRVFLQRNCRAPPLRDDDRQRTRRGASRSGVAPWAGTALTVFCLRLVLFILYLYALLLDGLPGERRSAPTMPDLAHYRVIFTEGLPAIEDTLIIALIGMPIGGLYGVIVGYLVARTQFIGRQAMEIVTMLNYALPGTIVGIAYLVAFNEPPFLLTGTAAIIIACYVFRYSPTGIRTTVALLQQIDRSIEEASFSLGASSFMTFRRIMLPLIMPAFFAG